MSLRDIIVFVLVTALFIGAVVWANQDQGDNAAYARHMTCVVSGSCK
jgi:hypothetical protein